MRLIGIRTHLPATYRHARQLRSVSIIVCGVIRCRYACAMLAYAVGSAHAMAGGLRVSAPLLTQLTIRGPCPLLRAGRSQAPNGPKLSDHQLRPLNASCPLSMKAASTSETGKG